MKEKDFMNLLKRELYTLPRAEVNDILSDYEEYFLEGKKRKRTEANIIKSLGDPKKIAKNLKAEYHLKAMKERSSLSNISKAILALISVGLFNAIIVIGPLISIIAVILSAYITVVALGLLGIATLVVSIYIIFKLHIFLGLSVLFGGIALSSLSVLLFFGLNFLSTYFVKGMIWYLKINIKIVKGEKNE